MKKTTLNLTKLLLITSLTSIFSTINNFNISTGEIIKPISARQEVLNVLTQGEKTLINNREINLPWVQLQEGNQTYIGISDVALQNFLGVELLNNTQVNQQPIQWFNTYVNLPVLFLNPYRYLDTRNLLNNTNISFSVENDILKINFPNPEVKQISESQSGQETRLIIELSNNTFYRVRQTKEQAIITLEAQANPSLITPINNRPNNPLNDSNLLEDEGEGSLGIEADKLQGKSLFTVAENNGQTLVTINLPQGSNIKINSSPPNRLFVSLKPDALTPKTIRWSEDILWEQKYLNINSSNFFISTIKVNLRNGNLNLRPITSNDTGMMGIAPLKNIAQPRRALLAINGGFFNRNNQLPLGALKTGQNWLSSPILNRGVMAWDDRGNVKISRLQYEDTITSNRGTSLTSNYVNSGYIKAGVARYTPSWGRSYTTLSDNEVVMVVENNTIWERIEVSKAGSRNITIPLNGYLLVFRSARSFADRLQVNDRLTISTKTNPADLANYPHILGAGPVLLQNSQIVLDGEGEQFSRAFNQQRASRSGVAVDRDGNLLLVAVHQRVGGAGPSLTEFAQILQRLGAMSALNLDGGGSSQIYLGGDVIDRSGALVSRIHNGLGLFEGAGN
ncbi:MAG: phosphodiester glycosidase family protein [Cyanobacterium sp. T60_A2020_053]|nr:phosphodiester glycosidase family protein [Cyanobacterium sp. T60_A2020_053]